MSVTLHVTLQRHVYGIALRFKRIPREDIANCVHPIMNDICVDCISISAGTVVVGLPSTPSVEGRNIAPHTSFAGGHLCAQEGLLLQVADGGTETGRPLCVALAADVDRAFCELGRLIAADVERAKVYTINGACFKIGDAFECAGGQQFDVCSIYQGPATTKPDEYSHHLQVRVVTPQGRTEYGVLVFVNRDSKRMDANQVLRHAYAFTQEGTPTCVFLFRT